MTIIPFLFYFIFPSYCFVFFYFSFSISPLSPPHPLVSLIAILTPASPFTPADGSLAARPCSTVTPVPAVGVTAAAVGAAAAPTAGRGRREEGGRGCHWGGGAPMTSGSKKPASRRRRHLLHRFLAAALRRRLPHRTKLRRRLPCPPWFARRRTTRIPTVGPIGQGWEFLGRSCGGYRGSDFFRLPRGRIALVSVFCSRSRGEAVFLSRLVALRQK